MGKYAMIIVTNNAAKVALNSMYFILHYLQTAQLLPQMHKEYYLCKESPIKREMKCCQEMEEGTAKT